MGETFFSLHFRDSFSPRIAKNSSGLYPRINQTQIYTCMKSEAVAKCGARFTTAPSPNSNSTNTDESFDLFFMRFRRFSFHLRNASTNGIRSWFLWPCSKPDENLMDWEVAPVMRCSKTTNIWFFRCWHLARRAERQSGKLYARETNVEDEQCNETDAPERSGNLEIRTNVNISIRICTGWKKTYNSLNQSHSWSTKKFSLPAIKLFGIFG